MNIFGKLISKISTQGEFTKLKFIKMRNFVPLKLSTFKVNKISILRIPKLQPNTTLEERERGDFQLPAGFTKE